MGRGGARSGQAKEMRRRRGTHPKELASHLPHKKRARAILQPHPVLSCVLSSFFFSSFSSANSQILHSFHSLFFFSASFYENFRRNVTTIPTSSSLSITKESWSTQTLEPSSFNFRGVNKSNIRHHRSLSQTSLTDDQPPWLDDLLDDSHSVPKGSHHARSASDSAALFNGLLPSLLLSPGYDGESASLLESGCTYGPNSPRHRSSVEFSDGTALLAFSDFAVSQSPIQFVDEIPWSSGTRSIDLKEDYCDAPSDLISESKSGKRHPGQRSRARKLQYIAELEKTVNVFQTRRGGQKNY